jgi:hypothetical protein
MELHRRSPITRCVIKSVFLLSITYAIVSPTVVQAASLPPTRTLIDDFESSASPAPWQVYFGPSFIGDPGTLTLGAGHIGHGAHLTYDFSKGGSYVEAFISVSIPATAKVISFWCKSPLHISVDLQAVDASGQTLQYSLGRPLAAADVTAWYQQVVELGRPSIYFGGAADGLVHYPLKQIGILADRSTVPGLSGAIDFDDVYAVSSTQVDLDPAATLIPAPAGSGDLLSRMGVNIHFTSDDRALSIAQAAGFSWVRMDLFWSAVETRPNVYVWNIYDQLISSLQSRGMKALFILGYDNALYTGSSIAPPTTPAQITAFGNFAQAAAQHFAGTGTRFEVWNEPNLAFFWAPAPVPAQYAALAMEASERVHQGDPTALVTTGGTSCFDENFISSFLSLGGGSGADAIGVHPYDIQNPPVNFMDKLVSLKNIVSQYLSPAPPIWDTEGGFTSTDYSTPAGNGADPTARFIQSAKAAERILTSCAAGSPIYIYYDLRDDGTDPTNREDNFGLIANDYSDKPALWAVQTLASVARNRTFKGFVQPVPSSLVAMRFDGPTDQVYALWSFAPDSEVTVTFPTNATVIDLYGSPLTPLQLIGRLAIKVQEGAGPVYIRIPTN